jgi:hypothetical protein
LSLTILANEDVFNRLKGDPALRRELYNNRAYHILGFLLLSVGEGKVEVCQASIILTVLGYTFDDGRA